MIILKNRSIWEDTVKIREYPKLMDDKSVDVLIIGGGITGVSTLYQLRNTSLNVMLVEQNKIGLSVTGKSTGKLTYLQNDLIDKIRSGLGEDKAKLYFKSQIEAIKMIIDIIKKEKINCDLEKVDSYLYINDSKEVNKVKDLADFLKKNNIKVYEDNISIVQSKYMIKVTDTYMFHPIKFIYGLLKNNNYPIYENTSIKKIEKQDNYYICYTDKNIIKAKWVVLASHYPYFIIPYFFPMKASLEKSYLSASIFITNKLSLISYSNPFISIRTYKDNLIYLSNSHDVNVNVCDRENYQELIKKLSDLYLSPEYLWSNIDIITNDGLPYIGKIKENMLISTGYNTWGLTNGVLAGKILSDIILNDSNEYIKLFNPKRINLKQLMGNASNIGKTLSGYVNGLLYRNDKPINFCPHAGCKLIFNEIEKTWDCPCHGSRFSEDGKCISGPSNKDINA